MASKDFPSSTISTAALMTFTTFSSTPVTLDMIYTKINKMDGRMSRMEVGFEDYGPDCENMRITAFLDIPGQDNLTPLARLEKYAFSDNIFNRQIIARGLLDVLRDFSSNEEDFLTVMEIVVRLSEDAEPSVRTELMEQVPPIAIFLQESRPNFPMAFSEYLMPIVLRYLTDPNNQVRKASQEALLMLLDQELIDQTDIENKVCPILLDLSSPDSDDEYKVEAVNIICKMTSMMNRDTVEQMLLPRFCDLCSDGKLFQVRKVCAANFGDVCNAVGQEATEKFLIPKFLELCSDSVWGMRKACAECFMAVSYTTSGEIRRTKLSPLFINLISDPCRWVLKDAPSSQSLAVSQAFLRMLTIFKRSAGGEESTLQNLDKKKVRQAAFQSLGPFISTFANPSSAGLYIKEDGTLSIRPAAEDSSAGSYGGDSNNIISPSFDKIDRMKTHQATEEASTEKGCSQPFDQSSVESKAERVPCSDDGSSDALARSDSTAASELGGTGDCPGPGTCVSANTMDHGKDMFSSFFYWRSPLPDISQDLKLLQPDIEKEDDDALRSATFCNAYAASSEFRKVLESLKEHMDDPDVQAQVQVLTAALRAAQLDSVSDDDEIRNSEHNEEPLPHEMLSLEDENKNIPSSPDSPEKIAKLSKASSFQSIDSQEEMTTANESLLEESTDLFFEDEKSKLQDIIPQPLLDQYLSMTDPARAQTVDTEIAKHCAYSLPGVALTLGRQNWHCLKDTYETLASDVQWKVRRTLAFSIHELAVILGDQLTAADLVPIFNGFLKDLDEVRIGVLKHLYDFLKLLHADKRREYLYQLQEFMVTDNSRNWRFRYELAEQLILILELYNPNDVYDYLRHIALTLCSDKVSEVRWISFKLVVEILQKFYANKENELGINFINELIVRFRHCSKWVGRQAFAFICQAVVEEECIPVDQFVIHLLPSLLSLTSDPVPNVRVLLAKALKRSLLEKAYFTSVGNPHLEAVEGAVLTLQSDRDQDVRFFATAEPKRNNMDTTALENQN